MIVEMRHGRRKSLNLCLWSAKVAIGQDMIRISVVKSGCNHAVNSWDKIIINIGCTRWKILLFRCWFEWFLATTKCVLKNLWSEYCSHCLTGLYYEYLWLFIVKILPFLFYWIEYKFYKKNKLVGCFILCTEFSLDLFKYFLSFNYRL